MELTLTSKKAIVTGAGGAIGGAISDALAGEGVHVALWDLRLEAAKAGAEKIRSSGGHVAAIGCDITDEASVNEAFAETLRVFGGVDMLINVAGGSSAAATTSDSQSFFDLIPEHMQKAVDLNYLGSVRCCQVVGRHFAERSAGAIVNITSIAGLRPLTRAISYSDAKAAFNSFTRWLAVHMALEYSPNIRVNAIAPGFFLTEQNRFLLIDEKTGDLTDRGNAVLKQVPVQRFGEPEEITGIVLYLVSDWAKFVTGAVIPVDGGFTAYAGV